MYTINYNIQGISEAEEKKYYMLNDRYYFSSNNSGYLQIMMSKH